MKDRLKKTYKNSEKGPKVHSEVKTDEKKQKAPSYMADGDGKRCSGSGRQFGRASKS